MFSSSSIRFVLVALSLIPGCTARTMLGTSMQEMSWSGGDDDGDPSDAGGGSDGGDTGGDGDADGDGDGGGDVTPTGPEVCNGLDDDNDGIIDNPGAAGCTVYWRDRDGDGFGVQPACFCAPTPGYVVDGGDCDDTPTRCGAACAPDLAESPGAGNCGDGYDNDCDGLVDYHDPDCARMVFVSSATGPGQMSLWPQSGGINGLAGADAVCRALAADAGLLNPDGFVAWLSSDTVAAADRIVGDGRPWVRLDGVQVAASGADLLDDAIDAPINVTETGVVLPEYTLVWTGTDGVGQPTSTLTCSDWSSLGYVGELGDCGSADVGWTHYAGIACGNSLALYCFGD